MSLSVRRLNGALLGLVAGAGKADEDDLAGELAAISVEMFGLVDRRDHDRRADGAIGAGRPGDGDRDHVDRPGRDHARIGLDVIPAAAELEGLAMHVAKAVAPELGKRPIFCAIQAVRIGQATADTVHELVTR